MADLTFAPLTVDNTQPVKRVPAHVSTVEAPISYMLTGHYGIADPNGASAFGIPHDMTTVDFVGVTPTNSYANTGGAYVTTREYIQSGVTVAATTAGATTVSLSADSPATADALNGFWILFTDGANEGLKRKIVDFASDVVTLNEALPYDLASGAGYKILGTLITIPADPTGGAPEYDCVVFGKYN